MSQKTNYKYLTFYVAAFVACFIVQGVFLNRLVRIDGSYYITGGTFIYFASPLITDVVAEVYGYQIARQILWLGLFSVIFLAISTSVIVNLPYPSFWQADAAAYYTALHTIGRATIAGIIAVIVGQFVNIYLISKWKILLRGKYFWFRSVASSIIGDTLTVTISLLLIFLGRVPEGAFSLLLIPELVIMISFSMVGAVPAYILAKLTAKAEGLNSYDIGVNFNPFILSIKEEEKNS